MPVRGPEPATLALLVLLSAAAGCIGPVDTQLYDPEGPIVAFGDSYTEGTGALPSEAYPALLERELGIPVLNAGVAGQTALEGLTRLHGDVLVHRPRLIIVEFGVNEAYRGYPAEVALDGLGRILARIEPEGIPTVLVGVHFYDHQENFDRGLEVLAARYGSELALNVLDGVLEDPSLRSDPFHPNAEGYRIMFERVLPPVERALVAQSLG